MPMLQIKITKKKDGREVAWFRDTKGRVRTSAGPVNWTRAELMREVGELGIQLQLEQVAAGLGSDGTPMPALKGSGRTLFVARVGGQARFERRTYADEKVKLGLRPIRDLRGPGRGGHHMLDDIRVNYLDDKKFSFAITSKLGRDKARGNEKRAPWWGWSPASMQKLIAKAGAVFPQGLAERLVAMGLMSANELVRGGRVLRRVA